ncbi:BON domain-containing protein [Chitinivorax sp. B]|uniref:BON domain-containing protein n=1 Tax=Chitinivorax sp. B TaxID=2502235 RepID=UPI0014852E1D|nr:BON domain-containing protein [Chitinivorax sp. B]
MKAGKQSIAIGTVALLGIMQPGFATTPMVDDSPQIIAASAVNDTAITAKVKAALIADPAVAGLSISVETKDGVVILTGKAKSEVEKSRATEIVQAIEGVKSVQNEIKLM